MLNKSATWTFPGEARLLCKMDASKKGVFIPQPYGCVPWAQSNDVALDERGFFLLRSSPCIRVLEWLGAFDKKMKSR